MTILLTGATGFIAKHVALNLLNAGHAVRATVRKPDRAAEVRSAVAPHLTDPASIDRMAFVTRDLDADAGWDAAMAGVDAVIHTASPFPLSQPKDENAVIGPALEGTRRVLGAAHKAGVHRVVLTSSTVAILHADLPPGRTLYDETDWSDLTRADATPYAKSKTLAERAAWEFVHLRAPEMQLTVINPGFVMGPPLDRHFGTSVAVVQRILAGRDPMQPRIGFPMVDVRDVAEMHVRALSVPDSAGRRFAAVAGSMWFAEMARVLKAAYPDRRIALREAPTILLRALALFDPQLRSILPSLGHIGHVSNAAARSVLGMEFTPPETALLATAAWLTAQPAD